ncbi:MAG: GDP-mannose 4,6-dehydratase [Candidatus Saccharicenans sp.]
MRVLITGINGFIGSHLLDYLSQHLQSVEIFGLVRPRASLDNLKNNIDKVKLIEGDLLEFSSVMDLLANIRPDRIFHLAGQTVLDASWALPQSTFSANVLGTINLLEALKELRLNPLTILASAGEAYGLAYADELPMKETSHWRPLSPFGASKAAQDLLGFQYYKAYGLKVIRTRLFDTIGPRQPDYYFVSNLAKQIAEIEKKKKKPLVYVAHLETKRDYTDIRDLVRAIWLISEKGEAGEAYNLGSGQAWSGNEILKMLLGMTRAKLVVENDEKKAALAEPPILLADISKLVKLTGWRPQINLKQSTLDLLNYWRESV